MDEDTEYSYELKIPLERVAVLIGKSGETKERIEEETHCRMDIDSKEGEVRISGRDSIGLFTAREIIKAIGRGFNPDIALLVLKSDYVFDLLNLQDFTGRGKKSMIRLKGRVIGNEGKSRNTIEALTETYISVYGKTIGIIGSAERVTIARKAIESLLEGSPHATVYRWLERKSRDVRYQSLRSDTSFLKDGVLDEGSSDETEDDESMDKDL